MMNKKIFLAAALLSFTFAQCSIAQQALSKDSLQQLTKHKAKVAEEFKKNGNQHLPAPQNVYTVVSNKPDTTGYAAAIAQKEAYIKAYNEKKAKDTKYLQDSIDNAQAKLDMANRKAFLEQYEKNKKNKPETTTTAPTEKKMAAPAPVAPTELVMDEAQRPKNLSPVQQLVIANEQDAIIIFEKNKTLRKSIIGKTYQVTHVRGTEVPAEQITNLIFNSETEVIVSYNNARRLTQYEFVQKNFHIMPPQFLPEDDNAPDAESIRAIDEILYILPTSNRTLETYNSRGEVVLTLALKY